MGNGPILMSPSLLSADFTRLREDVERVEAAGADLLHVDVMDGHFVPNLTLGPFIVEAVRRASTVPLDVHLMIDRPARYAQDFAAAGANRLTYHVECEEGGPETAELIRGLGMSPGICIRPDTPVEAIVDHLAVVDLVLVMSVQPGFAGQKFMAEVLVKTRALREEHGFRSDIEMDGGVGPGTIGPCAQAGANVFVAGSAIFGTADPAVAMQGLREEALTARRSGGAAAAADVL